MIYLDNHATTPMDPRVMEVLRTMYMEHYANAGSITHELGRDVASLTAQAQSSIAGSLGAAPDDIVFTSGATESNNLALFGVARYAASRGSQRTKIVSLATEHRAVLDPLQSLSRQGFEVVLLPVQSQDSGEPGVIDLDRLRDTVDDRTLLVSVMSANNEIGVNQPLAEIAQICHERGALLHTDATQSVGKEPIDVESWQVDLLSFSAHKFYGPKAVGGLYVRRSPRRVKLQAQLLGGGQQDNRRSGTLNSPGIVAMAKALELCTAEHQADAARITSLRNHLFSRLRDGVPGLLLNGPRLDDPQLRLAGNLNCSFEPVEGQSLMLAVPQLAVSSGSACTSAEPRPSHVLRALGLSDERARSSLRFGIGRFNTLDEIDEAANLLAEAMQRLTRMLG